MSQDNKKDILFKLRDQLKVLDTSTLFGDLNYDEIEDSCIEFLSKSDYKVVKKPKNAKIKRVDELRNKFYNLKKFYHVESKCEISSSPKRDEAILSRFVSNRVEELGCSKEKALSDCSFIIESLFKYEKDLGLDEEVGIGVFGTDKCKWITDRVISMANRDNDRINEYMMDQLVVSYGHEHEDEFKGFLERDIKGDKHGRKEKERRKT